MLHLLHYFATEKICQFIEFENPVETVYINLNEIVKISNITFKLKPILKLYHVVKLTDGSTYCITTEELQNILNHPIYNPLVVINEI